VSRRFLIAFGIGLAAAGLLTFVLWFFNLGSQVRLESKIVKVRIVPTDDEACVAVLELRLKNPAQTPFVVRTVTTTAIDASGAELTSDQVAQMDLDRVLEYNKAAGPRYNPVLFTKRKMPGGSEQDWTVAASFKVPAQKLESRRNFTIRIDEVDGVVVTIQEKR